MSRDKPTLHHDPKRDKLDKPDASLPDAPSTKPGDETKPPAKPDQELPPEATTKPVEPISPPVTPDQGLPPSPDQSLPPEQPGQPTQPLPINPDNGLPEVPPGVATLPVPPGTPTDPVTGEPLPQPPTRPVDPDFGVEVDDGNEAAEDKKLFVIQHEHEESSTFVWLDTLATFPTEDDAAKYLDAIRVDETKTRDLRLAAGSVGGDTGRFRVVLRTTTEQVITVIDFRDPPPYELADIPEGDGNVVTPVGDDLV